jgi:hypothetical protein
MTLPGQRTATRPISPHANLAAVERIGITRHGSAIWRLACTCGHMLEADAPTVRRGAARCPDCNPTYGDLEAERILAVLPATIEQIVTRSGMTLQQVRYRLTKMKSDLCHIGQWRRQRGSGRWRPVFVAGPGEDVECKLEPRTGAENNRRYRARIRKARDVDAAAARERHEAATRQADEIVAKARAVPQTWLSALMQ